MRALFFVYDNIHRLPEEDYKIAISHLRHKNAIILKKFLEVENERDIIKEKDNRLNKGLCYEIDNSKVEKKGKYQNYKAVEWMALNDN